MLLTPHRFGIINLHSPVFKDYAYDFFFTLITLFCGAVVKHRTRDREVPGSNPTNIKCCFLEQETLSTLFSIGFYPGKKRDTWKISTSLLNVLPSINKVDYYYYFIFLLVPLY